MLILTNLGRITRFDLDSPIFITSYNLSPNILKWKY